MSSLYMLSAGIVALGALKTLPTYGYGTIHEIKLEENGSSYLARALVFQEKINIVRHLRNETAYQSLRNGFLMLFVALAFSVVILAKSEASITLSESDNGVATPVITECIQKGKNEDQSENKVQSDKVSTD